MAINYPTSLDTTTQLPTNRADGTPRPTNHAEDHNDLASAVLALEAKVGINSSAVAASLDYISQASICQGRLALTGATSTTLYFVPYKGNRVVWGGGAYRLTLSGYSCSITSAALAANTLYYVYVYSNGGSPALEFQAATIPYVAETDHKMQSNGDETKTGDTSRLLVGMVRTNATAAPNTLFRTGARYANVISFHNRMPIFLAGVGTTATTASATYEDMATESDNLCEFLTWGSQLAVTDAVTIGISGSASSNGAGGRGDILFGTTGLGSAAPVSSVITFTSGIANELQNVSGSSTMGLVEGHHEVNFWGQAYGGATISVWVNTFASTNG